MPFMRLETKTDSQDSQDLNAKAKHVQLFRMKVNKENK